MHLLAGSPSACSFVGPSCSKRSVHGDGRYLDTPVAGENPRRQLVQRRVCRAAACALGSFLGHWFKVRAVAQTGRRPRGD
jgi:hypothetical protein